MIRLKKLIFLFLILSIIFLISGCVEVSQELPKTSGEVMKIGNDFWPGQFWITIANEKGWFEEAGLKVVVEQVSPDYLQTLQNVIDGDIDIYQFVLYDIISSNLDGADLMIIIDGDISHGADVIVAKQNINGIADLKGKTVGVTKNSFAEFMLNIALNEKGLTLDYIDIIDTLIEDPSLFINNEVDAIVTYEPFASEAIKKGNGKSIFDSSEIPGLIPDVFVTRKTFLKERQNDIQAYVNVWHKTTEFIKENPDEAFDIIANSYGVSVEDVTGFAKEVKILDLRDNKIAFSYAAGFESLHGTTWKINNFMIEQGITNKKLDSTKFIDASFIRNIE